MAGGGAVSPLTGSWLLPATLKQHRAGNGRLSQCYRRLLSSVLRHRMLTLAMAMLALLLAGVGTTYMQGEFFPASDRPELLVSWRCQPVRRSRPPCVRCNALSRLSPPAGMLTTIRLTSAPVRYALPAHGCAAGR